MEAEAGRRRVAIQPPAFLPGLLYPTRLCTMHLALPGPPFVPRAPCPGSCPHGEGSRGGQGWGGSPPASETLTHSGDGQGAEMTKGRICGSAAPGRRAAPLFQPHPHRWGPVVLRHW